jgi:hypothetical protein
MSPTDSITNIAHSEKGDGTREPLCFPAATPPRQATKQQKIVLWSAWGILLALVSGFLFTSLRPLTFIPLLLICTVIIIGYTFPLNRLLFGPRRHHRHLMHYVIQPTGITVVIKDKTVRTIRWQDLTAIQTFDEPLQKPAAVSFHGGWNTLYWHVREGRAEGFDTLSIHATTVERGVLLKSSTDMEWIAISPGERKKFIETCQNYLQETHIQTTLNENRAFRSGQKRQHFKEQ